MLDYARHFRMMACIVAVLAVTHRWNPALGAVASFGLYGALHATAVVLALRAFESLRRRVAFVAAGASLSVFSASWSLYAGRLGVALYGIAKPALLLASASGLGAASYAILIRYWFRIGLPPMAIASMTLGCVVATLAVLVSRLYLHGGSLWFAAAWWITFSTGLWHYDPRRAHA